MLVYADSYNHAVARIMRQSLTIMQDEYIADVYKLSYSPKLALVH